MLRLFRQCILSYDINNDGAVGVRLAREGSAAFDSLQLACAGTERPGALSRLQIAALVDIVGKSSGRKLVAVRHCAHDVSSNARSRAAGFLRVGSDVFFSLDIADGHRLNPGALALADGERVIRPVANVDLLRLIRLETFHRAGDLSLTRSKNRQS